MARNVYSMGSFAEDSMYEAALSLVRGNKGLVWDTRKSKLWDEVYKTDLIIKLFKERVVFFIQVKSEEGMKFTFPIPRKRVVESLIRDGYKCVFKTIEVYGDVYNGDIDPEELRSALFSKNDVEAVECK